MEAKLRELRRLKTAIAGKTPSPIRRALTRKQPQPKEEEKLLSADVERSDLPMPIEQVVPEPPPPPPKTVTLADPKTPNQAKKPAMPRSPAAEAEAAAADKRHMPSWSTLACLGLLLLSIGAVLGNFSQEYGWSGKIWAVFEPWFIAATTPRDEETCADGHFFDGPRKTYAAAAFYFVVLFWCFLGVAISSDIFMVRAATGEAAASSANPPPSPPPPSPCARAPRDATPPGYVALSAATVSRRRR